MILLDDYIRLLQTRLPEKGFAVFNPDADYPVEAAAVRSQTEIAKFGKVDCYVIAKYGGNADAVFLKAYSNWAFHFAYNHRNGLPLGFGAMLVVYPLLIVDRLSESVYSCINSYEPKHFAAAEFPSVMDLSSGNLYYLTNTPLWGFAYYGTYRAETYELFKKD